MCLDHCFSRNIRLFVISKSMFKTFFPTVLETPVCINKVTPVFNTLTCAVIEIRDAGAVEFKQQFHTKCLDEKHIALTSVRWKVHSYFISVLAHQSSSARSLVPVIRHLDFILHSTLMVCCAATRSAEQTTTAGRQPWQAC